MAVRTGRGSPGRHSTRHFGTAHHHAFVTGVAVEQQHDRMRARVRREVEQAVEPLACASERDLRQPRRVRGVHRGRVHRHRKRAITIAA